MLSSNDIRVASDDHIRMDAVHHIWVASLADCADQSVLDANIGLVNPGPVNNQRVRDHDVKTVLIRPATRLSHAIANRLATAKSALITVRSEILLHFNPKIRSSQSHAISNRRSIDRNIVRSVHRKRLQYPISRRLRNMQEATLLQALQERSRDRLIVNMSSSQAISALDDLIARDPHQSHSLRVSRLKPHTRAPRNVQPEPSRPHAIELQHRVDFHEMEVASNLDRPVSLARNLQTNPFPPRTERNPPLLAFDRNDSTRLPLSLVDTHILQRPRELVLRRHRQEAPVQRALQISVIARDRVVDCDQVCSVDEVAFDL